jgi:periplasmic divalent cation tolerance protein
VTDAILVIVSCREDEAQSIAQSLVEEKLAACVSILPAVKSIYIWQEQICHEQESLLLIKTSRASWVSLEKRIKELHSYTVPEILALPIEAGHQPYIQWLLESSATKRGEEPCAVERRQRGGAEV